MHACANIYAWIFINIHTIPKNLLLSIWLCLQKNSTKRVEARLAKEPYKKRALFTKDFWSWNWRGRGGIHIRSAPLFAPASPTSPGTPQQVRMSHVMHTNELCHAYDWVMSHIRCVSFFIKRHQLHVAYRDNIKWVIWRIQKSHVTHVNEAYSATHVLGHASGWVMSRVWMSHASHMHVTYMHACCRYEGVTCGKSKLRVAHTNDPCHTSQWVMSHMWIIHVTHTNESCRTYDWVLSLIWMSGAAHHRHGISRRIRMNEWMSQEKLTRAVGIAKQHMYVCTHTHTYTHVYIYTYVYVHMYTYVYNMYGSGCQNSDKTYKCMHTHTHTHTHICIHMYMYIYMYIYKYMYIHIYIYV